MPLLNTKLDLSIIEVVVLIEKALFDPHPQARKGDLVSIIGKPISVKSMNAVVLALYDEAVQMIVAPTKGNLQNVMKLGDCGLTTEQKTSPDHGTDARDRRFNLEDDCF